jgi:hypothetical protein
MISFYDPGSVMSALRVSFTSSIPTTNVIAAIVVGYKTPEIATLVRVTNHVLISGTRPPKTPLPRW